jgi:type II secretory pathway component PulJ
MIPKLSTHSQHSGFTLTELMIAAFISISVVAFGGWSVATVISSSKTNESQNERRGELNRALDFMSAEIRQAVDVNKSVDVDHNIITPSDFTLDPTEVNPDSVQKILAIQSQGLSNPVIYYIASPAAANLTWRGPKVLYRWGPSFDADGRYDATAASSTWVHTPLIDALEDTDVAIACPTTEGWSASPPSGSSATGFYACIKDNKIAQLHLNGRVSKALGITTPYLATAQAFVRAIGSVTSFSSVGSGGGGSGATTPTGRFTVSDGVVKLTSNSTTTMKILGSAIQCGKNAPAAMNTQLVINEVKDGQTTPSTLTVDPYALPAVPSFTGAPAGTTFNFTGSIPVESQNSNNTCNAEQAVGAVNSQDNSVQVRILQNGQTIPDVPGFAGSVSAKNILKNNVDPLDSTKIKLDANQYIVLFELGVKGDISSDAFDLQDLVVLATVNPV